jgi:kynurenine formamidase
VFFVFFSHSLLRQAKPRERSLIQVIMSTVIKYGPHPLQRIGIYSTAKPADSSKWAVFIHGGAWRDPSNTYKDGQFLLQSLMDRSSVFSGAASIDYRLSPEFQHPSHLQDVLEAVSYIVEKYSVKDLVLVGHSAGAFLALQAVTSTNKSPALVDLLSRATIVCSEGIYNLPSLIEEQPGYSDFVDMAFGTDRAVWKSVSPLGGDNDVWTQDMFTGTVVIVHSPEDELLGIDHQPAFAETFLRSHSVRVYKEIAHGKHDHVFTSRRLVDIVLNHTTPEHYSA